MRTKRKQADREEKKLAKKLGGRTTPNSGATPFRKGDVEAVGCRIDHKYTDAKQYTFKPAELSQLIGATKWDEIAAIWVRFRKLKEDYVILSSDDFQRLLTERQESK